MNEIFFLYDKFDPLLKITNLYIVGDQTIMEFNNQRGCYL